MKRFLIPITLMIVAVLVAVPQATAQADGVVSTSYELSPDDIVGATPPGDSNTGFIALDVCYDQGGFNPQGESWTFTLGEPDSLPEGVSVSLPPDAAVEWTPPLGPEGEGQCNELANWEIRADVAQDAETGVTHTLTFPVTVDAPSVGTYQSPGGDGSADLNLEVDTEEDVLPGAGGDDNGTADDDPGTANGADTEEGPMPMPPLFASLTLLAFAILRRRD